MSEAPPGAFSSPNLTLAPVSDAGFPFLAGGGSGSATSNSTSSPLASLAGSGKAGVSSRSSSVKPSSSTSSAESPEVLGSSSSNPRRRHRARRQGAVRPWRARAPARRPDRTIKNRPPGRVHRAGPPICRPRSFRLHRCIVLDNRRDIIHRRFGGRIEVEAQFQVIVERQFGLDIRLGIRRSGNRFGRLIAGQFHRQLVARLDDRR